MENNSNLLISFFLSVCYMRDMGDERAVANRALRNIVGDTSETRKLIYTFVPGKVQVHTLTSRVQSVSSTTT